MSDNRTDAVYVRKRFLARLLQLCQHLEVCRNEECCLGAHMRYPETDNQAIERNVSCSLDAVQKILCFQFFETFKREQFIFRQFEHTVKIGNKIVLHEKPHGLPPHTLYIERTFTGKMNEFARLLLK